MQHIKTVFIKIYKIKSTFRICKLFEDWFIHVIYRFFQAFTRFKNFFKLDMKISLRLLSKIKYNHVMYTYVTFGIKQHKAVIEMIELCFTHLCLIVLSVYIIR